jgi:hypothetical protein
MAFNINDFKARGLAFGGARPSLFQVDLTPPFSITDPVASQKFTFTCNATTIPPANIGSVPVPYFGRKIKLAGDREFDDWSVTVMNDEDFLVRNMFENWSNLMNTLASNLKITPGNSYKSNDATVTQFAKDGAIIRQYSFIGLFPISVSSMDLNWDATNTIQSFGVTFAYDYWVPRRSTAAPASDIPTGQPGAGAGLAPSE